MAKKTWKIGEYCKGGVITTEVKNDSILIIGKDWDFSTGSKKSSNQSNAKEFTRFLGNSNSIFMRDVDTFLNDLTTSYYTDQIMDWIKEKL